MDRVIGTCGSCGGPVLESLETVVPVCQWCARKPLHPYGPPIAMSDKYDEKTFFRLKKERETPKEVESDGA